MQNPNAHRTATATSSGPVRKVLEKLHLTPRQKESRGALAVLSQRPQGQVYAGTANRNAVAKRHAKNKVARRSRAINRRR